MAGLPDVQPNVLGLVKVCMCAMNLCGHATVMTCDKCMLFYVALRHMCRVVGSEEGGPAHAAVHALSTHLDPHMCFV